MATIEDLNKDYTKEKNILDNLMIKFVLFFIIWTSKILNFLV